MNKPELLTSIAKKSGLSKIDAERALEAVIVTITDELMAGSDLRIADLGKFSVTQHKEQTGRNPRTREPIIIPAHKRIKFRPAKFFRDVVQ